MRAKFIYEKFQEKSDPIEDMGIGIITQIKQDLKDAGIPQNHAEITTDGELYWAGSRYAKPSKFLDLQLKYFPEPKKSFISSVIQMSRKKYDDKTIWDALQHIYDEGVPYDEILKLIEEFGDEEIYRHSKIILAKFTRTPEKAKEDEENNIYAFIGYDEKVPVIINGKKYYEDVFTAEKMVKIDKYNKSHLNMVGAMKMRANFTNHGKVYIVTVPKELMDEDYYNGIPEKNRYIIEKYKRII